MRGRPVTNHELAALITASGRSHAALARKVNVAAAARHGLDLRYDQASVYWWLRGRVPEEPIPGLLAGIFSEWLGLMIQMPDLGFTDPGGHLGLDMPATAAEAVESASELWRYVLRRRVFLGVGFGVGFAIGATVSAGFDWHFAPSPAAGGLARQAGPRTVGMADVERIRQARTEFAIMDHAHGGGHAFPWLVDYLDRELAPMLHGTYPAQTGRDLFTAASSLTELAGWMAYDQGKSHGLAQRFFIQALGLARHAGDRAYGAHVVSDLATQALFLNHGAEATRLARAAISGAGRAASPAQMARLAAIEAQGFALTGDHRETRAAIRRADRAADRSDPSDAPSWLASYTPAHQAGAVMHALRDLGQYRDAARYADLVLELPAVNVRARALHTTLLATVQAGQGEIDAACDTASRALAAAPELTSARLNARLRDFAQRISPYSDQVDAREYLERSAATLPTA